MLLLLAIPGVIGRWLAHGLAVPSVSAFLHIASRANIRHQITFKYISTAFPASFIFPATESSGRFLLLTGGLTGWGEMGFGETGGGAEGVRLLARQQLGRGSSSIVS